MALPLVSVIITTKNEVAVIGNLIRSLHAQIYKKIEIILVDNQSDDRTAVVARDLGVKVYSYGPERSSQRNFGVKKSKGKFLLVLDADMKLTNEVISQCVDIMQKDSKVGGVVIPEVSVAKNFWEKVKAFERSFYYLDGENTVEAARFFRAKVFKEIGGYDETLTGPEDWDLPEMMKVCGYKIKRCKAKIYHYERINSLFGLMKKKYYYGLKSHRYFEKHQISIFSPKSIYFFRSLFYKRWKKLLFHPVLTLSMFTMFVFEIFGGGIGYLQGRLKKY